jgi:hypothetical protein
VAKDVREETLGVRRQGCIRHAGLPFEVLLIVWGFFLPHGYGTTMSIGPGALLALTGVFASFSPPHELVYNVLLGITVGVGGVVGLLAGQIG